MRNVNMKIQTAMLMAWLLVGSAALHADPITVAVYDFAGSGVQVDHIGAKSTAIITAELTTETNLVMLDRARLSKELNEQAFGISGMVSSDAAAKIGQLSGAKVLVSGQVIRSENNHLTMVANIIGTETGRLFAAKMEGGAGKLVDLSNAMGHKIAEIIMEQATNLVAVRGESRSAQIDRIMKSISGTNRPVVSVNIFPAERFNQHDVTVEGELGALLLKAGFPLVDAQSERKPDIEISGSANTSAAASRDGMSAARTIIDLKIQERRTGNIVGFDRQENVAADVFKLGAETAASVGAVDKLAERVLPLLAK